MPRDADVLKNMNTVNKWFKSVVSNAIKGDDMADLTTELVKVIQEHKLFMKDTMTGRIVSSLRKGEYLSESDARNLFMTYFMDKLKLKTWKNNSDGDLVSTWKPVTKFQLDTLFNMVIDMCTFNSRIEMYNNIPEWDGTDRITTFMKEYYSCDAKPEFFLLFLTGAVGKLKCPARAYVPYFFDFIGNKGVGKSYLFTKLFGDLAANVHAKDRKDELFAEIYARNILVAIDDEGVLSGQKKSPMCYDALKEFVTARQDTFSQKFQHAETHDRSFIFVRTSNESKTVFSADERRQVIFESHNKPNECRILDLPDEFWQQMLAQAKDYFEKYGVYQMNAEDRDAIHTQQLLYINDEDVNFTYFYKYIWWIREGHVDTKWQFLSTYKARPGEWADWDCYSKWAIENRAPQIDSKTFWKCVRIAAEKKKLVEYYPDKKYKVMGDSKKLFRIRNNRELENTDFMND